MDHCISAVRKKSEEKIYRMYVTDTLMHLTELTARLGNGTYKASRYVELMDEFSEKKKEVKEERSPEEIIASVRKAIRRQKGN